MLIDSTYFIGEKNIPNTSYQDVSSLLENLIAVHEKEYLVAILGYELFKLFDAGLQAPSPDQRYLDILLGKEYTSWSGRPNQWTGLVSVTDPSTALTIGLSSAADIYFSVGATAAPAAGEFDYVNTSLAGANYRVTQRGFGPLEPLNADNSNVATADIVINSSGGFSWLNGIQFSLNDKYLLEMLSADIDVSTYSAVAQPESPIADYVYYWYLRNNNTQTAAMGEVAGQAENATKVSPGYKMAKAWNDMVAKNRILREFLLVNNTIYPEYQNYPLYAPVGNVSLRGLLTKINPWGW